MNCFHSEGAVQGSLKVSAKQIWKIMNRICVCVLSPRTPDPKIYQRRETHVKITQGDSNHLSQPCSRQLGQMEDLLELAFMGFSYRYLAGMLRK